MLTRDQIIENLNYAKDARVRVTEDYVYGCLTCGAIGEECGCPDEGERRFEGGNLVELLPSTWEVCDLCNGEGTHVNPSIDCNGLTAEDFHDDPDFAEEYMRGTYDVPCNQCNGRTTVKAPDWSKASPELLAALQEQRDADDAAHAEHLAELRMGA